MIAGANPLRSPSSVGPFAPVQPSREAGPALIETVAASAVVVRRDEAAGRFVYEFRDPETGALIRQFPSETLVALAAATWGDAPRGMLLSMAV